jgi:hypothetical protein
MKSEIKGIHDPCGNWESIPADARPTGFEASGHNDRERSP